MEYCSYNFDSNFITMMDLLVGILIGATMIGSSVQRTLQVGAGRPLLALMCNAFSSVGYYYSVFYVVDRNFEGFIGTCIGSSISLTIMAYLNKRKRENYEKN